MKNTIYKYMTILKNVNINKSNNLVNKNNNTYHSTIKMKPVDVKWSTYIDPSKEFNDKDPKFNIGDIFKTESNLLMILIEKKLLKLLTKKNCKKQIRKSLKLKS